MISVAVAGASGRMGRAVLSAANDREDLSVVLAVNRDPRVEAVAGVPVEPPEEIGERLRERGVEVLVEFTGPDSAVSYARACAEAGVALVSGTTGLSEQQEAQIDEANSRVPVVRASNFAPGVSVLERLVREAARSLPEYDVELVEAHHDGKRDAPSGTAGDLLEAVDEARQRAHDRVYGREGEGRRSESAVGVHSLRAGDVAGEHALVLAGDGEQLRIEHRAGGREAFAAGALDAAVGVAGRSPGRYDLAEVRA